MEYRNTLSQPSDHLPLPSDKSPVASSALEDIERTYELRKREPNLIFVSDNLIGAHENGEGRIIEGNNGVDLTFHAVVAEFNNRIDPRRAIGPIDDVSAEVTFGFFDGREPLKFPRGVWIREGSKADFGINDTHRLVVASIEGLLERQVYALNGSYSGHGPKRIGLPEGLVKVTVALTAELRNKVLRRSEFMLETRRDTDILIDTRLIELWRWKYDQLLEFVDQGVKLAKRYELAGASVSHTIALECEAGETIEEVESAGDHWAARVSQFLATYLGEPYRLRFIMAVSASGPSSDLSFVSYLVKGNQIFLEFAREVRQSVNNS